MCLIYSSSKRGNINNKIVEILIIFSGKLIPILSHCDTYILITNYSLLSRQCCWWFGVKLNEDVYIYSPPFYINKRDINSPSLSSDDRFDTFGFRLRSRTSSCRSVDRTVTRINRRFYLRTSKSSMDDVINWKQLLLRYRYHCHEIRLS